MWVIFETLITVESLEKIKRNLKRRFLIEKIKNLRFLWVFSSFRYTRILNILRPHLSGDKYGGRRSHDGPSYETEGKISRCAKESPDR